MIKVYASDTTSGTSDSVATLDIPEDLELRHVQYDCAAVAAVDAVARWELSLASSSGFTTNDTRSSLVSVSTAVGGSTPTGNVGEVHFDPPLKLNAGERLHLHNTNTANLTVSYCSIFLHTTAKAQARRTRL